MEVVIQLVVTAAVYALIVWAIREHPSGDSSAASTAVRRPWFRYGLLIGSSGLLLMGSAMALSGWSDDPNPVTAAISMLTILAGGAVSLFGFVDRYVLRRHVAELRSRRAPRLTEAFVAGFILLPLTAIFSCTGENPRNSSRPTSAPTRQSP